LLEVEEARKIAGTVVVVKEVDAQVDLLMAEVVVNLAVATQVGAITIGVDPLVVNLVCSE